jgi:MerR family mercuric resistance operon transcriptional regulator
MFSIGKLAEAGGVGVETVRFYQRKLAATRIKALDRQIAQLQRARASLNRLAQECEEGTSGTCPIIAAFDSEVS